MFLKLNFHNLLFKFFSRFLPVAFLLRSLYATKVGKGCRFINCSFGSEPYLLTFGSHVSATNCFFITHDGSCWIFRNQYPDVDFIAPISIGSNVFLGINCSVLPGTIVEDDCIFGACSLLKGYYPSGYVYAGIPAKRICTVQEYYSKNSTKFLQTKTFSPQKKRSFLISYFYGKD